MVPSGRAEDVVLLRGWRSPKRITVRATDSFANGNTNNDPHPGPKAAMSKVLLENGGASPDFVADMFRNRINLYCLGWALGLQLFFEGLLFTSHNIKDDNPDVEGRSPLQVHLTKVGNRFASGMNFSTVSSTFGEIVFTGIGMRSGVRLFDWMENC